MANAPPLINMFAVVDKTTGNQLMHVIDAHDPTDPAWNPPNSVQISIPISEYIQHTHASLDAAIINYAKIHHNLTVKTAIVVAPVPNLILD